MYLLRGRGETPTVDREATATALRRAATDRTPAVRVWTPHRQVAFGRRDAREEGYGRAKRHARDRGYQPVERDVGGRAVAYTGETLAFAVALPIADARSGLSDRYDAATEAVVGALTAAGARVEPGEPPESFCPGAHSIRVVDGGKVSGIAQRVREDAALVAGCLTVAASDEPAIASTLDPVYDALGVPFEPASVGSVAGAGGPDDPALVRRTVESALAESDLVAEAEGNAEEKRGPRVVRVSAWAE